MELLPSWMSMSARRLRELRETEPTYSDVGASLSSLPVGFRHDRRRSVVGRGFRDFDVASHTVLTWGMHRGTGLQVRATAPEARTGETVVLGLGLGPLRVTFGCRVVAVVDEPRRRGFAYGSLPGHPETGEEFFLVELTDEDAVVVRITSFSRPAWRVARLLAPLNRAVQVAVTVGYLRAVARAVRHAR